MKLRFQNIKAPSFDILSIAAVIHACLFTLKLKFTEIDFLRYLHTNCVSSLYYYVLLKLTNINNFKSR